MACTEKNQGKGNERNGPEQRMPEKGAGKIQPKSAQPGTAHAAGQAGQAGDPAKHTPAGDNAEQQIAQRSHRQGKGTAFGKPYELLFFLHRAPTPNMLIIGQNETARKENE